MRSKNRLNVALKTENAMVAVGRLTAYVNGNSAQGEFRINMQKPKTVWLEEQERTEQLGHTPGGDETAYFGFQRIAADKKTDQVTQHFNSVARRYDFMNTLLSFGIHHLWKRTAIKLMELAPGDSVVDVCGGTGDLATASIKSATRPWKTAFNMSRATPNGFLFRKQILTRPWSALESAMSPIWKKALKRCTAC
jgi:hypothetical protein